MAKQSINKSFYNSYEELPKYRGNYNGIEHASREELLKLLSEHAFSDSWLDVDNLSTLKLREIAHRLNAERVGPPTPFNGRITDKLTTEKGFYGSNEPTFTILVIDTLKACKNAKDSGEIYTLLDLGCGWGSLTWKALLAGCRVYANDISFSSDTFRDGFEYVVRTIVPDELYKDNLVIINSSLYDIPKNYPDLLNSFDIIYSARALHFQTPKYFSSFANIVNDMLHHKGKAFITVDTVYTALNREDCLEVFNYNKEHNYKAPGYLYISHDVSKNIKKCLIKSEVDLLNADYLPPHKIKALSDGSEVEEYYIAGFDQCSLEKVFKDTELQISESYYFSFNKQDKFTSLLELKEGVDLTGVALVLDKSEEVSTSNNTEHIEL